MDDSSLLTLVSWILSTPLVTTQCSFSVIMRILCVHTLGNMHDGLQGAQLGGGGTPQSTTIGGGRFYQPPIYESMFLFCNHEDIMCTYTW